MTAKNHVMFWGAIFVGFLGFVFIFKSILLPFVLGIAVAYLLNPLVSRLGTIGLSRGVAALLILSVFFAIVVAFFAALIPILYKELAELSVDFPGYVERVWVLLTPISKQLQSFIGIESGSDLKALMTEHAGTGLNIASNILKSLSAGGQALLGMVSVMVFMPIVAYFMMKEWVNITKWVETLMPRDHKKNIKNILSRIDQKLSGFVRGQISVAVMLGLAYALSLTLVGLKYGFLIGVGAGLLSVIPMVGSAIGLAVSVLVAWFQAGDLIFVGIVAGIFLAGQLIEGNILTPKLVGDSVGLHPLWVFFALLAGGSLFGVLGMLLAVPVAAVVGVLLGFGLTQYKSSAYFRGQHGKQKTGKKKKKANANA